LFGLKRLAATTAGTTITQLPVSRPRNDALAHSLIVNDLSQRVEEGSRGKEICSRKHHR
jgi:hypothetical protein